MSTDGLFYKNYNQTVQCFTHVTSVAASHTLTVRQRREDGCPGVRVNTPGLLQQSHVRYC